MNISIVTAFFDIGRGRWRDEHAVPDYLHRTTDTYFERFAHLAKLENDMTVFTSEDLAPAVRALRGNRKTSVITIDFENSFGKLRHRICEIQNDPEYKYKINHSQIHNPEYWNADYVLVNAMKSKFACMAIDMETTHNELVAWLDFGYCRDQSTLNGCTKWSYPFDPQKIHLFTIQEFDGTNHYQIISNNLVYVTGPCIVAGQKRWSDLHRLFFKTMNQLMDDGWIDDDQSILLQSSIAEPEKFELHPIQEWFVAFKEFNENLH